MKTLLIDNYDSFTYNLAHYIEDILQIQITIVKNDQVKIELLNNYDTFIISPGPETPIKTPQIKNIITHFKNKKRILGVCLGHQIIGEVFGAQLINTQKVYHGISTPINIINKTKIFNGVPNQINVGRYHSWVISKENFPNSELEITALSKEKHIMAVQHKKHDITGIQFHPESILTPSGYTLLKNWLLP